MTTIAHATIVMDRTLNAAPARVFAAWADVEARKRWSAPADNIRIEYEAADFREGGRESRAASSRATPTMLQLSIISISARTPALSSPRT
jgi:uncharacterized protein YndB with AHSA1/START domain